MRQKDDTKNVPCWGPKKVNHRHTKFIRHSDLPPEICTPLEGVSRILQKSNLNIVGARRAIRRKFRAEDQRIVHVSATAQNSVEEATCGPGFAHTWSKRTWMVKWQSVQHAVPTLKFRHSSPQSEWLPSQILWLLCIDGFYTIIWSNCFNPLNAELNPICHLLALLGARHILHVSRIRVNPYPANVVGWSL